MPSRDVVDWRVLYEDLGERVFRLLHRMTGDPEEAADLTHDTFVRVHENRLDYAGRGSLEAWVFRIAANLARDTIRIRQIRARHDPNVRTSSIGQRSARQPNVALRLDLERALASIDPSHRVVMLLHDVDGFQHREIAEMLDVAIGTSKSRLSRARRQLREIMYPEPENG